MCCDWMKHKDVFISMDNLDESLALHSNQCALRSSCFPLLHRTVKLQMILTFPSLNSFVFPLVCRVFGLIPLKISLRTDTKSLKQLPGNKPLTSGPQSHFGQDPGTLTIRHREGHSDKMFGHPATAQQE